MDDDGCRLDIAGSKSQSASTSHDFSPWLWAAHLGFYEYGLVFRQRRHEITHRNISLSSLVGTEPPDSILQHK